MAVPTSSSLVLMDRCISAIWAFIFSPMPLTWDRAGAFVVAFRT